MKERYLNTLAALHQYVAENSIPPTYEELRAAAGLGTRSATLYHVRKLEAAGYVRLRPNKARAIILTNTHMMEETD